MAEMDAFLEHRLARKLDPATSHEAAASVVPTLGDQHHKILAVLADGIPRAAEQIGDALGFPVWRRMNELERLGKISRTAERHVNRSGRQAFKYAVVS